MSTAIDSARLAIDAGPVLSVAISLDGSVLASGGADNVVRLWDSNTGDPLHELTGHTGKVRSVAISPDGSRLASSSDDRTVRIWDTSTGRQLRSPLTGHTGYARCVAFSPDGRFVASASDDGTVRLWDPAASDASSLWTATLPPESDRVPTSRYNRPYDHSLLSIAFSPNGSYIVAGSRQGSLFVLETVNGQPQREPLIGHSNWVKSVAFAPDGTYIASASDDNTVRLWDSTTGQPLRGSPLDLNGARILALAFSLDGTRLALAGRDSTIQLWNPFVGQPHDQALIGHADAVTSVAFSRDEVPRFLRMVTPRRVVTEREGNTGGDTA